MKSLLKLTLLAGVFSLFQGCSSISNNQSNATMNGLIIAEPLPISFQNELAISRLSEVILRADVTNEQRAELLYERGIRYDSVGLYALARQDFVSALRLKNNLANAYNFLGILFTQLQQYSQAYDQFDAAIELAPEHEYAYFNRGIALLYGDRAKLAVEDLDKFYHFQANDPFRLIWLYFAESQIDQPQALASLKQRSDLVSNDIWAKSLVDLYLGNISQSKFIQQLPNNVESNEELTKRLCEAYFYLGKLNQLEGKPSIAENYFKLALATNVYEYVEHRYAKVELDRTKQAL